MVRKEVSVQLACAGHIVEPCQVPIHVWAHDPAPFVHVHAHTQDVLIQNSDRHHGHFLWADHWAQGRTDTGSAYGGWQVRCAHACGAAVWGAAML